MAKITLNENEQLILDTLNSNGKGYIVGGAVRDMLLGLQPNDTDFCTDIDYNRLKDIFKNNFPKEVGKHFGVIEIIVNNVPYEIAKLRKDKHFQSRTDTDVQFTNDILEDLSRRDFTINAIAFDGTKIITLNQLSINDLYNKIIRFVGDSDLRIIEDPLRMIRAIRFSSQKNFMIEKNTFNSITDNVELIKTVAKERIYQELMKMLESKHNVGMMYFYKTNMLSTIFNTYSMDCRFEKMKNIIYDTSNINARIYIFYLMVNKSNDFFKIFKVNKIEKMINMLDNAYRYLENNKKDDVINEYHHRKIKFLTKEHYTDFIDFVKIYLPRIRFEHIEDSDVIFLNELSVDGNDLIDLVNKKDIGKTLLKLLDLVHENQDLNNKSILLEHAKCL